MISLLQVMSNGHLLQPGAPPIAIASSFSERSRHANEHVEPGHDGGVSVAVESGVRAFLPVLFTYCFSL